MTSPRWRDAAIVAAAASSWGAWSLVLRPTHLPATATSVLVLGFGTLWLAPLALRGDRVVWSRRIIGLLAAYAAFDAINVLTFFAAIDRTTVAIAVITHYLAPVLVAVAAPRIDRTRSANAIPAAVVAFVGLALVVEPWRGATGLEGAALGVASAVAYAGIVFVCRRLTLAIGAVRAMAYHGIPAALLVLPLAIDDLHAVDARDVALLGIGTLVLGAIAGVAYLRGLARIGAARAAVLTYCEPLVAVAVGALVWHEPIAWIAALGAALVLGAGVAVARSERH